MKHFLPEVLNRAMALTLARNSKNHWCAPGFRARAYKHDSLSVLFQAYFDFSLVEHKKGKQQDFVEEEAKKCGNC